MATVPHGIGVYLGVVQFFFTLTWTVYVMFLPQLAARSAVPALRRPAAGGGRRPRRAEAA